MPDAMARHFPKSRVARAHACPKDSPPTCAVSQARAWTPSGTSFALREGMNKDPTEPRFVILVAADESPTAQRVIAEACALARTIPGSELHLLYAADPTEDADLTTSPRETIIAEHRQRLDDRARDVRGVFQGTVVVHVGEGSPAHVIVQMAASIDADLVVVGTRGRRGVEQWLLGSVATRVTERSACPVLVVRAKDHVLAHAPEIEPPCAECLQAQGESRGARLWCARHAQPHLRPHVHYELPEGFGAGSGLIRMA